MEATMLNIQYGSQGYSPKNTVTRIHNNMIGITMDTMHFCIEGIDIKNVNPNHTIYYLIRN